MFNVNTLSLLISSIIYLCLFIDLKTFINLEDLEDLEDLENVISGIAVKVPGAGKSQ